MFQQYAALFHGRRHEHGASAVEYALLVALIAAVVVVAVIALGGFVSSAFTDTTHSICDGGGDSTAAGCDD